MISAVIFDMDGILIDSEPFWKEADVWAYQQVGLTLTHEQCAETTGMDTHSSVKYWFAKHPWQNKSIVEVQNLIEAKVVKLVDEKGDPMPGLDKVLAFFQHKNLPVALASSSAMHIIEAVLRKLDIKRHFKVYHSAQFEIQGKPDPAVFLTTANKLKVKPEDCLVFEDSFNGVKAARAANMKVVAMPDMHSVSLIKPDMADAFIGQLSDFNEDMFLKLL